MSDARNMPDVDEATDVSDAHDQPMQPPRHAYVHVPFCARRCSYCDFAIAVRKNIPVDDYLDALTREVRARGIDQHATELQTLYLGGGTPSLLGVSGIARLIDLVRSFASLAPQCEITLEANPEDISVDSVRGWRSAGINRLSIGVQSFHDNVLKWMHRVHDAASAIRAVSVARDEGLDAFSLDLIFALPESLNRDWSRDIDEALALTPDHISLYGLTVESHTPLGRWRDRGAVHEATEDKYESDFLLANSRLSDAGYDHYEVSNFAKRGRRAAHNSVYWAGVPYVGLGPSAHGFDGDTRRWNAAQFADWCARCVAGSDPMAGSELLTTENRIAETVYLGLRTIDGLSVNQAEMDLIQRWIGAKWLEWVDSTEKTAVRCTPLGWLRLDSLAADLTALRSHS